MSMDDNEIKLGFLEEGEQLIEELETLLLDLEHIADKKETMDGIFRIFHNIKGSARAVGFEALGAFCHELETYLLEIKNGQQTVTGEIINGLLKSRDILGSALTTYKSDMNATVDFNVHFSSHSPPVSQSETSQDDAAVDSVESLPPQTLVVPEKKVGASSDTSVRVNLKRVDQLINSIGELVVLDSVLRQQSAQKGDGPMSKTVEQIAKIIREVQDLSMSLRMVPVKTLIQKLQRICRDTSTALNKSVDFKVIGEDIEIDKTILDAISDPLVHLVRNAIDHGLESAADRQAANKSATGTLTLKFLHEGGKMHICLKDDGAGLDRQRITDKALEKGLITSAENLSEQKVFDLIFAPGFSTKANVTEVSGRGVGMDVVRTSVEALGGNIEISSEFQRGTEFKIALPLTVAIIEGMVVKSKNDNFIIPFTQVSETVKVIDLDLKKGPESGTLLNLRGKYLPVYSLQELLDGKKVERHDGIGIITKTSRVEFVVIVDNVIGQQQIVVKQLGAELSGFKRFVGSGVLGDGKPALILDLAQLADEELKRIRK